MRIRLKIKSKNAFKEKPSSAEVFLLRIALPFILSMMITIVVLLIASI
jgi:hypothetical protein